MRPARNTECGETVTKRPMTRKEWSTHQGPAYMRSQGSLKTMNGADSRSHRCHEGLFCGTLGTTARQRTEVSNRNGYSSRGGRGFPQEDLHVGRREREQPRLRLGLGCVCRKYQGQAAEDTRNHRLRKRLLPTALPFSLTCRFNTHLLLLPLSMDDSSPQGAHIPLREVGLDTDTHNTL